MIKTEIYYKKPSDEDPLGIKRRLKDLEPSCSVDSRFNIIQLDQKWTNCAICNKDTPLGYSIPMYEGKKVDTRKTDEWAGMPVCKGCFDKQNKKDNMIKRTRRELIQHLVFECDNLTQDELEKAADYCIEGIRAKIKSENQGIFGWDKTMHRLGILHIDDSVQWFLVGD